LFVLRIREVDLNERGKFNGFQKACRLCWDKMRKTFIKKVFLIVP